jgi:hypothetical protein
MEDLRQLRELRRLLEILMLKAEATIRALERTRADRTSVQAHEESDEKPYERTRRLLEQSRKLLRER